MSSLESNQAGHGTTKSYGLGFGLSVLLTLLAFGLVQAHVNSHHSTFSHSFLIISVVGLALIQLVVQAAFFLHLGRESKPRWNLTVFLFMIVIVSILVFGSLWIMTNLNYHHNHLSPAATDKYLVKDEGF